MEAQIEKTLDVYMRLVLEMREAERVFNRVRFLKQGNPLYKEALTARRKTREAVDRFTEKLQNKK